MLVVDRAIVATGWSAHVAGTLEGIPVIEHHMPVGEPTVASVDAAADAARRLDGVVVVGVGGGSALDRRNRPPSCALGPRGEPYLLGTNTFAGRRPIVAIPTTSGTGAEVTRRASSATGGEEGWTWGDEILPDAVVLDRRRQRRCPACDRLHWPRRVGARDRSVHRATAEPALVGGGSTGARARVAHLPAAVATPRISPRNSRCRKRRCSPESRSTTAARASPMPSGTRSGRCITSHTGIGRRRRSRRVGVECRASPTSSRSTAMSSGVGQRTAGCLDRSVRGNHVRPGGAAASDMVFDAETSPP